MDEQKGAADRAALYLKCARVYWLAGFSAHSDRAVRTLATLPNWREAIDAAYEAGLTDGAQMAVGTVGKYPAEPETDHPAGYDSNYREGYADAYDDGYRSGYASGHADAVKNWPASDE